MTSNLYFSIVVPLYNKAAHIKRCIDSIISQSVQDFEIIIINDGSTDDGAKIVESIKDRRIKLYNQDNSGVSIARNRGVEKSKHDYITFLDADDTWEPNHLSILINLIEKYPKAGLYATAYRNVNIKGEVTHLSLHGIPANVTDCIMPNYFKSMSWDLPILNVATVAVHKSIFNKYNGFTPGVVLNEDTELWTKIAIDYPVAYSTIPTATYYRDSENRACMDNIPNSSELPYYSLIQKAIQDNKIPPEQIRYAKELIAKYSYNFSRKCLHSLEREKSRYWGKIAISSTKTSRKIKSLIIFILSFLPIFILKPLCAIIWNVHKNPNN